MRGKLTSRKFWVAAVSIVAGILTMLGAPDNAVQLISGVGLILAPAIAYIAAEGKIDAASVAAIDVDSLASAIKAYLDGARAEKGEAGGN